MSLYKAQKMTRPFTSNGATQGTQHMSDGTFGAAVQVNLCKIQHMVAGRQDWIRHNIR